MPRPVIFPVLDYSQVIPVPLRNVLRPVLDLCSGFANDTVAAAVRFSFAGRHCLI